MVKPKQNVPKPFPVAMDLRTSDGMDRQISLLNNYFPSGKIPVVCPNCGAKNKLDLKNIEKEMKKKGEVVKKDGAIVKVATDKRGADGEVLYDNVVYTKRLQTTPSREFDPCIKCGQMLVFESPMSSDNRETHVPIKKERTSPTEKEPRTIKPEPTKRWNTKTGKWEIV